MFITQTDDHGFNPRSSPLVGLFAPAVLLQICAGVREMSVARMALAC